MPWDEDLVSWDGGGGICLLIVHWGNSSRLSQHGLLLKLVRPSKQHPYHGQNVELAPITSIEELIQASLPFSFNGDLYGTTLANHKHESSFAQALILWTALVCSKLHSRGFFSSLKQKTTILGQILTSLKYSSNNPKTLLYSMVLSLISVGNYQQTI